MRTITAESYTECLVFYKLNFSVFHDYFLSFPVWGFQPFNHSHPQTHSQLSLSTLTPAFTFTPF